MYKYIPLTIVSGINQFLKLLIKEMLLQFTLTFFHNQIYIFIKLPKSCLSFEKPQSLAFISSNILITVITEKLT